jgi:hypothetical protein
LILPCYGEKRKCKTNTTYLTALPDPGGNTSPHC